MSLTVVAKPAKRLWSSLPAVYRLRSVVPHEWEAYKQVLPSKRHRAVGKKMGKTSLIELADTLLLFKKQERTRRFNNTLRQRVGRLVRKTLSFSPK